MKFGNTSSNRLTSYLLLGTAIAALPVFAAAQAQPVTPTEQVTVTGTIIKGAGPTGSNLITVNRAAMEDMGAVTVSQVLADVPGLNNFGSAGQGAQNSSDPGGASSPTIHSLGNSASNGTLILVDGHRLPYTGIQHNTIDPSAVPFIALQQVQVLPDGASATYGSDAVAGVLNFITRKNYSGLEAQAQYGFADNYNSFSGGILGGKDWSGGSALVAYEYSSKSRFANGARSYETARQDLRLGALANPASFAPAISATPPAGFATTTPSSSSGTSGPFGAAVPYPSLGSNFQNFACPTATIKTSGNSTSFLYPYTSTTNVVNNITSFNGACDEASYGSQLPSETRNTVFMSFKQALTDDISISGDFDFSTRLETSINARGTLLNFTAFGPTSPNVTQRNPFYNVGTTGLSTSSTQISYDLTPLLAGLPKTAEKTGDTVAFTNLGLDWDLGHDWDFSMGATFGVDVDFDRITNGLCVACATLALNGTTNANGTANTTAATSAIIDPQGLSTILSETRALTTSNALDVWDAPGSTNKTSAAVLKQLAGGFSNTTATQGIQDFSMQVGGSPFELPAGPVKVAFGGEFLHTTDQQLQNTPSSAEGPSSVASQTVNLFYGRTVWAAFGEILAPIVSPEMNIPLVQKFTLDMSGRADQYTTYGGTKNPKVGFIWQMFDGLQGRGSYGTSFTVPAFASGGKNQTGITSQSAVNSGGSPTVPVPFNNTTYNGGAGVAGTWVSTAASCAAAGSQPVDANGNSVTVASGLATACKVLAASFPAGTGDLQYAAGGKPGLKPEVGTTYSAGFDFDLGKMVNALDGLTGEMTFYQAKYAGLVTSIGLSTSQPGLTYFAPIGGWSSSDPAITSRLTSYPLNTTVPTTIWTFFDGRQTNAYTLWENGFDYALHYVYNSDIGQWTGGISGNQILRFTQQNNGVNQPLLDIKNGKQGSSGRFAGQDMTWRATLNWDQAPLRAGLGFNFQSPFFTNVTAFPYNLAGPGRAANLQKIPALFTMDLNAGFTLPDTWYAGLRGSQITLSVSNLLDTDPPFQDSATGLGAGSQLGRLVTVSLKKVF